MSINLLILDEFIEWAHVATASAVFKSIEL